MEIIEHQLWTRQYITILNSIMESNEYTNIKQDVSPTTRVRSILTGLWQQIMLHLPANPDCLASPSPLRTHPSMKDCPATLVNPWGHLTCGKEQALSDTIGLLIPPALFQSLHGLCWSCKRSALALALSRITFC